MVDSNILSWPALELPAGEDLPQQLSYERGIWGKVHGASSDFRWIARSASFALQHRNLEQELQLGSEDNPQRSQFWRNLGDTYYAGGCYPSGATDEAGRSGFLEKQIIEWRCPSEVPAAVGALLLLPEVARYTDVDWWEERTRAEWTERDFYLTLDKSQHQPRPVSGNALEKAIERGIQQLLERVPGELALVDLYARLLAGQSAIPLVGLTQPLLPTSLGILMLPLSRDRADRLSMVSWLPSRRVDAEQLRQRWNWVLAGAPSNIAQTVPEPSTDHRQQAEKMVQALLEGNPAVLKNAGPTPKPSASEPQPDSAIQLALWGPSAAGKTVLLAQLYLETETRISDWNIFPTREALDFIEDMEKTRLMENRFPGATPPGDVTRIVYKFHNRQTGINASLVVEDRAGVDYERHDEATLERLISASGLVLLVDPMRDKAKLRHELSGMLGRVHVGKQLDTLDNRPIAVCISKADILIETPADFDRASLNPDEFVREWDRWGLVGLLDRFCSNYCLFPVSSVGVELRYGVIETVAFYDERLTQRVCTTGNPFNLMAPFAWVINQVAMQS